MEHGALYYVLLGAAVVAAPAITDRLLKARVGNGWRFVLAVLAAALAGVFLALIARPLGL
jgi:hypothetical protein